LVVDSSTRFKSTNRVESSHPLDGLATIKMPSRQLRKNQISRSNPVDDSARIKSPFS